MSGQGAGARRSGPADPRRPMNVPLAATLLLEAIVLGLSTPVMIVVGEVPKALGLTCGLGLALVAAVASGMQRRRGGRLVGSLVQVGAVALSLLEPLMALIGALFAICWVATLLLEDRMRRIRREKGLDRSQPVAQPDSGASA
jgi:preprotein translocase subunit SecY